MTLGLAITLAMMLLTGGWIVYDLLKPRRHLPPLGPLCVANGKLDLSSVDEAERLFIKKTVELEELRQKAGIHRTMSDLKRSDDHLPGTDTAVVKAIDMKIEIAKHLAAKKKA